MHRLATPLQESNMNRIRVFPLMAVALLAATPGVSQAQHVVGGMGEEVHIGAFSGGQLNSDVGGRALPANRNHATGPNKGLARPMGQHKVRAVSSRGTMPTLPPGRQLP